MKKFYSAIGTCLITLVLKSNPLPSPTIDLSEFIVYPDSTWKLEIYYKYFPSAPTIYGVDSLIVNSSLGSARLKKTVFLSDQGYFVITPDSLISDLKVNPNGDSVFIYSYGSVYGYEILSTFVSFGDSIIDYVLKPDSGQSIARPEFYYGSPFSLDKSPTLGYANDSAGMCGTLTGKIYDINDSLVTNVLLIHDFPLSIDSAGNYRTRVYSKNTQVNNIYNIYDTNKEKYISVDYFSYSMRPDSVVYRDIHLLDTVVHVNIKHIIPFSNSIKISPSLIGKNNMFNYEIHLPVISSSCYFDLINMNGQKVRQYRITGNDGTVYLPSGISNGVYIIQLVINGRRYNTSKITITR